MQLVVEVAVRKAVSAATITFTAISMNRFFIIFLLSFYSHRSHRSQIFNPLDYSIVACDNFL